jgi:hypothetical protein
MPEESGAIVRAPLAGTSGGFRLLCFSLALSPLVSHHRPSLLGSTLVSNLGATSDPRFVSILGLSSLVMLTAAPAGCGGCPRPYTETLTDCDASGDVTITAPARLDTSCPPSFFWGTTLLSEQGAGDTQLGMTWKCAAESVVLVTLRTKPNPPPGTYTTAASSLSIGLAMPTPSGAQTRCYAETMYPEPCSLGDLQGELTVESASPTRAEAKLDLAMALKTGERIAISGHMSANGCEFTYNHYCSD